MAQEASRQPLTAEAWVRARVSPCGICGGQSSTGTGFIRILRFFPVNGIPPWLHNHIGCYHLGDEQQARWWSQLRHIVSPHRHE
jgi:hypothetical protein